MRVGKVKLVRVVDIADIFVGGIPATAVKAFKIDPRRELLRRLDLSGFVSKETVLDRLLDLDPNLNEISSSIELDRDLLNDCDLINCETWSTWHKKTK